MSRREVEPRTDQVQGTVTPYDGTGDVDPMSYHVPPTHFEVPEYVSLRPAEYTKIDETWSKIISGPRAVALAFLWITYRWHRVAILLATIAAIVITFKVG